MGRPPLPEQPQPGPLRHEPDPLPVVPGRGEKAGTVVIQTFCPDNYAVECAARNDYDAFVQQELVFRKLTGYPPFARLLMDGWHIAPEIQMGATDWRDYRSCAQSDLAATVHAAHVLAAHTMHPQLLVEEMVLESPVFEHLGLFVDQRRSLLAMRDTIRATPGA